MTQPLQTEPRTSEQRTGERFPVALPITMEGEEQEGATYDVSTSGILFQSPSSLAVGAQVVLSLHYRANGADHQLACQGEVVRVEAHGEGYDVAVRLDRPLFAAPRS